MKKFNILDWLYEYWVPVKGYEGYYEVSNWGRVKSLDFNHTKCPQLMTIKNIARGYYQIALQANKKRKYFKIHRLVAEHFLPNPNNFPIINHKDENRLLNVVWNLEWCTYKYNINYGTGIERRAKARIENKKGTKITVYKNGEFYKDYTNVISCSRDLGIDRSAIFKRIKTKMPVKSDINGFTFKRVGI